MSEINALLEPLGKPLSELIGHSVRMRTTGKSTDGSKYVATFSGTYLGVARDDSTREPMHVFGGGDINGIAQGCHGFPALDAEVTFEYGATELIRAFRAGEPFEIDGLPACPKCLAECDTYASDDAPDDTADSWICTECGAHGTVGPRACEEV